MIKFPNAKINIGLRILRRRKDGYHDLSTIFVPVGQYAGTPLNPVSFCDTLEIIPQQIDNLIKNGPPSGYCKENPFDNQYCLEGRKIDCPLEKNLVWKAVEAFSQEVVKKGLNTHPILLRLQKHIPDGAGLGGGSSDAAFTLKLLNDLYGERNFYGQGTPFSEEELETIALRLGADCPFFIRNRASYAEGVGEVLEPIDLDLSGWWCVIVKPDIYISTADAFSGVRPDDSKDRFPLNRLGELSVRDWNEIAVNDFELSLFPRFPRLREIKELIYNEGAEFASMSGSGSSLYGLFRTEQEAFSASSELSELQDCSVWPLLL